MSNKTEKPTQKRLRDAAKKGQSFKARDLIIACMTLCGVYWLLSMLNLSEVMTLYRDILASRFDFATREYYKVISLLFIILLVPVLIICVVTSMLPTLLQTGFVIASKALKLNFNALNPVKGFKKILSLRTLKDTVKALLHLLSFVAAVYITWQQKKALIFSQLYASPADLAAIWGNILLALVMTCLGCMLIVFILDALADYFIHIKELKMDKQEVKREMKELDGNPEIKSKRREMHMEILTEQVKADIKGSRMIIANPTHIAIGIYFEPAIAPAPFISVREINGRALAVRKYAEQEGIPVIQDIKLARRLYKSHKVYSFVQLNQLDEVLQLLVWLTQVENAWQAEKTV